MPDTTPGVHAADDWWGELDQSLLACLSRNGAMSPAELARHMKLSESATTSLLCLLASEGRVRICLVEPTAARQDASIGAPPSASFFRSTPDDGTL